MTTSLQPSALVLRKSHGRYALDGLATATASLRARGGMRRGEITMDSGTLPLAINDFRRSGATLGPTDAPWVHLEPGHAFACGAPVNWSIGRNFRNYHAEVSRGNDRISVRIPAFVGRPIRVEVVGTWEYLELIALTACFTVMSRRRFDRIRVMAISAAVSHH